ncbi:HAD family hydrolase [Actinoplanes flavus]|uniref:HAD-IA family hydrolase n=1 Tax=Actinoplanes flavus TaxID=2820290 RepID=A0ABS3UGV1_9ACTN|nr:HAD-IA family hydrolase [Actinoplanes flavus]MBO3737999.1 HAD-IA family hydrolase [Actinoplanes flavus]
MLYDLDGVIVDSKSTVVETLCEVAGIALGTLPPPEKVRRLAYLPPVQVLAELGVADAAKVFDAHFDTAYAGHARKSRLVAGMTAAMWRVRMSGRRQAIVTMQRRHRLNLLPLGEVRDLIDTIVCFEDATPKPAPDPLWLALDRLQIAPDQACFIGDTASDIRAGRAAGVTAYGAAWGYQDAAALVAASADGLLTEPADVVGLVLGERSVTVGYDSSATGMTVRSGSSP